jgi:hypothetical protein
MVTKAQLDRISQRIEALSGFRCPSKVAMVIVDGESEEKAWDRHCLAHPEDCEAIDFVFMHIVDPPASTGPMTMGVR